MLPDEAPTHCVNLARLVSRGFYDGKVDSGVFHVWRSSDGLTEWELYIPSRLAFGKRGPLENQALVYRLHLLAVIEGPAAADTP